MIIKNYLNRKVQLQSRLGMLLYYLNEGDTFKVTKLDVADGVLNITMKLTNNECVLKARKAKNGKDSKIPEKSV